MVTVEKKLNWCMYVFGGSVFKSTLKKSARLDCPSHGDITGLNSFCPAALVLLQQAGCYASSWSDLGSDLGLFGGGNGRVSWLRCLPSSSDGT